MALQNDIDAVVEWSQGNKLHPSKCKIITSSRSRSPISAIYEVSGAPLQRVPIVSDLKLTVDSKLSFYEHIEEVG